MSSSSTIPSRPRAVSSAARTAAPLRRWDPPSSVSPRGTLVVLPGRGEHAGVYERLGLRLAFDGYVVVAIDGVDFEQIRATVADLAGPAPLVLIGSDAGALQALVLSGLEELAVAAVITSGLPVAQPAAKSSSWSEELDQRTACPVHRERLGIDPNFRRGAIGEDLGDLVELAAAAGRRIPILAIHGTADEVSPLAEVRTWLEALPHRRLAAVVGGRHDVLNDLNHRSVAAEIVGFLERLRKGPELPPVIEVLT